LVRKILFYVQKYYLAFFVIVGGSVELQEVSGGVELHSRRSQEVRGRPELQNGGLRALKDAWMTTFC